MSQNTDFETSNIFSDRHCYSMELDDGIVGFCFNLELSCGLNFVCSFIVQAILVFLVQNFVNLKDIKEIINRYI